LSETLVSLMMPAWRPRAEWLGEAVRSALAQTGCAIELVLIDDGSPVPVTDLLEGLDDPRLRVIRIEHGGEAQARNSGIAEARGEYLRFIDADDVIEPASTSRLLGLCEGRGDLIAYGATLFCDENLRPLWKMTSEVEGNGVTACLLGRFQTRLTAFLFPRRVVELTGAWDPGFEVSPDWDFILRSLEHAEVRGTRSVAARYRRHPGGATANPAAGAEAAERVVARYFERHPEQRGTALERMARARSLAHAGRIYAMHRRPGKAASTLARAARLDPGAVWIEVSQGLPRLAARGRRVLRMEPQDLREPPPPGS
jgi:glycosyltransferase involved in cell wall biosynthesis